jgi:hypothetical protein
MATLITGPHIQTFLLVVLFKTEFLHRQATQGGRTPVKHCKLQCHNVPGIASLCACKRIRKVNFFVTPKCEITFEHFL